MYECLYHYTNIDSLALILKNKTIRFKPLDTLDDLQEKMTQDSKGMGKCCFVSSWTEESRELIPMWKMYTNDDQAVRIQLPKNPFKIYHYTPEEFAKFVPNPNQLKIDTIVPLYDVINSRYCVHPYNIDKQLYKVEYKDDENYLNPRLWKSLDEVDIFTYGKFLGKYKNQYWNFQKEWRYILYIFPVSLAAIAASDLKYAGTIIRAISDGRISLEQQYYDLSIDAKMYSNMKILLGPNISQENEQAVRTLIKTLNPSAEIERSSLSGLIK